MVTNLFDMSSAETGELYKALTKAQIKFTPCINDADNPFFKSKYASYEKVLNSSRIALAAEGLCVVSKLFYIDNHTYTVIELHHGASQQFVRCWQKLEPSKRDLHGYSGAHSYWRRIMYRDLIGVICEDETDDDGNIACNVISTNMQGVISADQLKQLQTIVDEKWTAKIFEYYKISNLAQLKQSDFDHVIAVVNESVEKSKK